MPFELIFKYSKLPARLITTYHYLHVQLTRHFLSHYYYVSFHHFSHPLFIPLSVSIHSISRQLDILLAFWSFFPNLKNKEQNGKISKHAEVFKGQNHPLTSAVKLCDSKTIQIRNSKLCNFTKVVLKYIQFF